MIKAIVVMVRQRFCDHVFCGPDMGRRNERGVLTWPCSKCGKVYEFEYGLQACDYGEIQGPWGI